MTNGFVLLFNRKETEYGYPYTNIYYLVEVEIDKEEWDNDPYIILRPSNKEICIGSWEEQNDYRSRVELKVERMEIKGKYLHVDKEGNWEIYDADEKKFIQLPNEQEIIEHNFHEMLVSKFILFP